MEFLKFDRCSFASHVDVQFGIKPVLDNEAVGHCYSLRLHGMVSRVAISTDFGVVEVRHASLMILLYLHYYNEGRGG